MRYKKFLLLSTTVALAASISACGIFGGGSQSSSSSSVAPSSSSESSSQSSSSSSSTSSSSSSSESSSSSSDSSEASSSSAPSSSESASKINWNGNYVMAEGSASQTSLTISGMDDKKFVFEFYIKGINYSGTATIDANSPHIATYQDPNYDNYSLTFEYSSQGIIVAEKGSFPEANCSFAGNFSAK